MTSPDEGAGYIDGDINVPDEYGEEYNEDGSSPNHYSGRPPSSHNAGPMDVALTTGFIVGHNGFAAMNTDDTYTGQEAFGDLYDWLKSLDGGDRDDGRSRKARNAGKASDVVDRFSVRAAQAGSAGSRGSQVLKERMGAFGGDDDVDAKRRKGRDLDKKARDADRNTTRARLLRAYKIARRLPGIP